MWLPASRRPNNGSRSSTATTNSQAESEVDQDRGGIKQLVQNRVDLIEALPEYQALEEARAAVEAAKAKLKIAVRDNRELAKLDVDIAEARFDLRDLREILSHALVLYTQQTGKVLIKEHDRTRQIELRARISKRLLGQERPPININRHLGQHFPIPVGMKVEGKPEEGGVMERNVVSLETAKKLKAAGFPRVSMWHYSERMDPPDELFFTQSSSSTQFDIAAPTAQEIADQLPGFWSVMNSKVTSNFHAAYYGNTGDRLNAEANTLAEVLANLLLRLLESGDLKLHEAHS